MGKKISLIYPPLLFIILLSNPAFAEKQVPADLLFKDSKYSTFKISPDGKLMAALESKDNGYVLHITDLDSAKIIHEIDMGENYPEKLTWIGNERLFYQLGYQIATVSANGGEHRYILEHNTKVAGQRRYRNWSFFRAAEDDEESIYVQGTDPNPIPVAFSNRNLFDIATYKLNIYTGVGRKISSLAGDGQTTWYIDKNGKPIIGYTKSFAKMDFYLRQPLATNQQLIYTLNIKNPVRLAKKNNTFLNNRIFPEGLDHENKSIYISHNLNSDLYRLFVYDIPPKEDTGKEFFSDAKYDVGGNLDNNYLVYQSDQVVGVRYLKDKPVTLWLDEKFKIWQNDIDSLLPGRVNEMTSWSKDREKIIITSKSNNHRGKIYLYTPATHQIKELLNLSGWLDEYTLPLEKTVNYTSADGTEHEAYLTLPSGYNGTPVPTVILLYSGGVWNRAYSGYAGEALYFATRGYAVLRPNFRGTTGFGRQYMLSGVKNSLQLMLSDIRDAAEWLKANKIADPEKLFIMGTGQGGYLALMSAIRYPDVYHGVVSMSAVYDLVEQTKKYHKQDWFSNIEYLKLATGNIETARLKALSPLYNIDKLKAPVLIFTGKKNDLVSPKQLAALKTTLEKSQVKYAIKTLKDENYYINNVSNRVYYMESAHRLFSQAKIE